MATDTHTIVIGGTRGLGLATAVACAARGDRVSIVGRNPPAAAVSGSASSAPRFYAADLRRQKETERTLEQIVTDGGRVRYLIFAQRFRAEAAATDDEVWAGEMQVTLNATRLALDTLGERFAADGDRAVCGVSSVYGTFVGDGQPVSYHVAKAGFEQLIRHYAFAWGPHGIRANIVAPCTFLKDESQHGFLQNQPLMQLFRKLVPLGRLGTAAESANVAAFLCSPQAAYVTGQTLTVDGGLSNVWPETSARRQAEI